MKYVVPLLFCFMFLFSFGYTQVTSITASVQDSYNRNVRVSYTVPITYSNRTSFTFSTTNFPTKTIDYYYNFQNVGTTLPVVNIFQADLEPGKSYSILVSVYGSDMTVAHTGTLPVMLSAPPAPANVTLVDISKKSINITWTPVSFEGTGTIVYFVTYPPTYYTATDTAPTKTTSSVFLTLESTGAFTLTSNTTYNITIQTSVNQLKSVSSIPLIVTTLLADAPTKAPVFTSTPSDETTYTADVDSLFVKWDFSSDDDGGAPISYYPLTYYWIDPVTKLQQNNTLYTLDQKFGKATGLLSGTAYTFIVYAQNKDGKISPPSANVTLSTKSADTGNNYLYFLLLLLLIPAAGIFICLIGGIIFFFVIAIRRARNNSVLKIEMGQPQIDPEVSRELLDQIAKEYQLDFDKLIFSTNELLGTGASGTVYRGTYYAAPVAVKLYFRNQLGQEKDLQDFLNEAKFLSEHSNHPNIVRFIGVAHKEDRQDIALVTELCTGGNLANYMVEHDLPFKKRLEILFGVASGMAHLHSVNIIHRDLKCENILLDSNLVPKIIDFGFSKQIQDINRTMNMTMNVGTAVYSAPEVVKFQLFSNPFDGNEGEQDQNNVDNQSALSPTSDYGSDAQLIQGEKSVTSDEDSKTKKKREYDMKCDVYSYAVIMWVVYNRNKHPYGRNVTDLQILHQLSINPNFRPPINGEIPAEHQWYIDLMQNCWKAEPNDRPSFEYINETLQEKLAEIKAKEGQQ